jgi:hypothetical protein
MPKTLRPKLFLRVIQALRQGKLCRADLLPPFIVGITLNLTREHEWRRHQTSKGQAMDDALRQAKLELLKGAPPAWHHPDYWFTTGRRSCWSAIRNNTELLQ